MRTTQQTARPTCPLCLALLALLALAAPAFAGASPASPDRGEAHAVPTIDLDEIERGQTGYGLSVFAGTEPERFEIEVIGVLRNLNPGSSYIMARLSGHDLERSGVVSGMSGSPVFIDGRLAGAVAFGWPFSHDAIAGITPIAYMRAIPGPGEEGSGVVLGDGQAGLRADASRWSAAERGSTLAPLLDLIPVTARPAALFGVLMPDLLSPEAIPPVLRSRLGASAPAGAPGAGVADFSGSLAPLERELSRLAVSLGSPAGSTGALPAIHWSASGFGELTGGLLDRSLGGVGMAGGSYAATGGSGASGARLAPPTVAPQHGGSVAAVLMDGDLRLAATGTITDVIGDRVLAFGHIFLGNGPISVPMAEAEVITVIANRNNSFKLSNVGPVYGAFDQDRRVGLQGHTGTMARTIPIQVKIQGAGGQEEKTFDMWIADVRAYVPSLVATAALGGLEAASWRSGEMGLDLDATLRMEGRPPLRIRQSFDGPSAAIESVTHLLQTTAYLLGNDLARVELTGAEITLRQHLAPRLANLVDAHADRTVVRPGETVELNLDLVAFRGQPFRHSLRVEIPEDLPAGRYSLLVGDGASIDIARLAVEPATPVSFDQALDLLSSFHSQRQLLVLGVFPSRGLAVAGEAMPRLPGSVLSLWGRQPAGSAAAPLRLAVAQQVEQDFPVPLSGIVRVDVQVERRDPVRDGSRVGDAAAGGDGAAEGGEGGGSEAAPGAGSETEAGESSRKPPAGGGAQPEGGEGR